MVQMVFETSYLCALVKTTVICAIMNEPGAFIYFSYQMMISKSEDKKKIKSATFDVAKTEKDEKS